MIESVPADLYKPLLEEFKRGWLKEQVLGRVEQKRYASAAGQYHRGVDGLGRLRARIPASSFHYWGQRLGYQCWNDEKFVKEYLRDNNLEVKGGKTKLLVGYGKSTSEGSLALLDAYGRPIQT